MSVPIPTVNINSIPMPQFIPRSRREDSTRDITNARNLEIQRSAAPIQQAFFRPEPSTADSRGPRSGVSHYDQNGLSTRQTLPISIPAPMFDPAGPKLVGNVFFDQHAPEYDPRNVVRELRASVKDDKVVRGEQESRRILQRGFSSRYVPEGYAEQHQMDSLQAFEQLRPKIDDTMKQYRNYE
jgi:hypothetical protein